jgi:SAM-dependent methyltransferase
MKWQVKVVLDSAKALLPFQDRLRCYKRRFFPYQTEPDRDAWTLTQGIQQILWLREAGFLFGDATVLEIGSGWQPIIPILYYLAGCKRIYLTDAAILLDRELVINAMNTVRNYRSLVAEKLSLAEEEIESRLSTGSEKSLEVLLEHLQMTYFAPCDTGRLPLRDASVDLVFSRAVLEHIPKADLEGILRESVRILRPNGLMLHCIDTSDHWEHNDKSITRVNYLRYPGWLFKLTCLNPLNYQNRLRHQDYINLLREADMRVIREANEVDERSLAELETMPLAAPFRGIPYEELAIITTSILALKTEGRRVAAH